MRIDYYEDYFEFENNNWWFVSRRKIIHAFLKKNLPSCPHTRQILDAGCGTGINLALLSHFGNVIGVDCSEEAIRFCHQRNEQNVKLTNLLHLPFSNDSFDLITALDVLEHIYEDEHAIQEISRVCKPYGVTLITVPVYPSLWGEHDEINQHVRRYEPKRLINLLRENEFEIVHRSFLNTWLLPVAYLWRGWRKIRRLLFSPKDQTARPDNMHHHPIMNWILTQIFSSEKPFILGPGLPAGLSLLVFARKRDKRGRYKPDSVAGDHFSRTSVTTRLELPTRE